MYYSLNNPKAQAFPFQSNIQKPFANSSNILSYQPLSQPIRSPRNINLISQHIKYPSQPLILNSPMAYQQPITYAPSITPQGNSSKLARKSNMDDLYNECMSKIISERTAVVSPSKKHFCRIIDVDNCHYEGQITGREKTGYGIIKNEMMQEIYSGDWKQDKYHGIGTLQNLNPKKTENPFDYKDFNELEEIWTKYEGEFVEGKKSGLGKLYLSNGEAFYGYFKNDMVDGQGTFWLKDGKTVFGKWKENKLEAVL